MKRGNKQANDLQRNTQKNERLINEITLSKAGGELACLWRQATIAPLMVPGHQCEDHL